MINDKKPYKLSFTTRILVLFLFLSFSSFEDNVDEIKDLNAKYKAVFIKNFTKHVEWPPEKKNGNFIIGIFGQYPQLIKELKRMAETKKVGTQDMVIQIYPSVSAINSCHILYIAPNQSAQLPRVINKVRRNNTLLITDKAGLAKQGAGINFIFIQKRLRFELNTANVKKSSLKVSGQLLTLAKIVN